VLACWRLGPERGAALTQLTSHCLQGTKTRAKESDGEVMAVLAGLRCWSWSVNLCMAFGMLLPRIAAAQANVVQLLY
jgi:hypothetical protein